MMRSPPSPAPTRNENHRLSCVAELRAAYNNSLKQPTHRIPPPLLGGGASAPDPHVPPAGEHGAHVEAQHDADEGVEEGRRVVHVRHIQLHLDVQPCGGRRSPRPLSRGAPQNSGGSGNSGPGRKAKRNTWSQEAHLLRQDAPLGERPYAPKGSPASTHVGCPETGSSGSAIATLISTRHAGKTDFRWDPRKEAHDVGLGRPCALLPHNAPSTQICSRLLL